MTVYNNDKSAPKRTNKTDQKNLENDNKYVNDINLKRQQNITRLHKKTTADS